MAEEMNNEQVEQAGAEQQEQEGQRMLPLTCRFCGTSTGEYAVPRRFEGLNIPPEQVGIVDSRCSECEATHGTVQQAEKGIEDALHDVGGVTNDEKRAFIVAAGWSAPDAIAAAQAERERRLAEQQAQADEAQADNAE